MTSFDVERVMAEVRRLHEDIRVAVGTRLEEARARGDRGLAQPTAEGAGDMTFALDELAEAPLAHFGRSLGSHHPLTVVAEGPGVTHHGEGAPGAPLSVLVDPVDGTRPLMLDLRSAWVLTGVAPTPSGRQARLSDVELAVQTELPVTGSAVYHVLSAVKGQGARLARHDVVTGEELECAPLVVDTELPLDNGVFSFACYLPADRPLISRLEHAVLEEVAARPEVERRLLYNDQYLSSAGQLYLCVTGRYRLLADLRAWVGRRFGVDNFPAKPYDLAALLVCTEAGLPVTDAEGDPLDAPFDTSTPLDVVAYGNESLRAVLAPILVRAMDGLRARPER